MLSDWCCAVYFYLYRVEARLLSFPQTETVPEKRFFGFLTWDVLYFFCFAFPLN